MAQNPPISAESRRPRAGERSATVEELARRAHHELGFTIDELAVALRNTRDDLTDPATVALLWKSLVIRQKARARRRTEPWFVAPEDPELLIDSDAYRARVRSKIGSSNPDFQRLFPKDDVVAVDWEVVYAIIGSWNNESPSAKLPFFSKVNLREFRRRLRRMGFQVTLARVPVIDP